MIAIICLVVAIGATTLGQVSFKKYARSNDRGWLITAIALFGVTPLFTFFAVRGLGLGTVYISTGFTYVLVGMLGKLLFGETIGLQGSIALLIISTGCVLYGM